MIDLVQLWSRVQGLFHQNVLLSLGILLIAGFTLGKLCELLRLPAITGYIVAGLLLSRSVSGIISPEMGHNCGSITQVALSLIALTIGGEFSFSKLRKTGGRILVLTLFEALFAFIVVTAALIPTGLRPQAAVLFGAIAAATAPAATVIIIREMRARGEFIDYLYGIVALDDAVCLILFSVTFAVVSPQLVGTAAAGGALGAFLRAFAELGLAVALGLAGGFLLHVLTTRRRNPNEVLLLTLSLVFLVTALAVSFRLSPLITNMTLGTALINLSPRNRRIFGVLEPLTPPVFALLFILAGTELDAGVFFTGPVIPLGLLYLAARFAGKLAGIQLAGGLTRTPARIRNYLGFCLFPQAGVAIGLALFVRSSPAAGAAGPEVQQLLAFLVNVVLFSVFINEFVGPIISRFGIKRGTGL